MAYTTPNDLDGFLPLLAKTDTRLRQQVGSDFLAYLSNEDNLVVCQDLGLLIDELIPWMQTSNYKVSSNGIEIMTCLIDRLGTDFRPFVPNVLPNVIDRLGDAKDSVREKSQLLLQKLVERNILTPQALLEKISHGFTHKNGKIREEVLRSLVNTLNEHGSQCLTLNRFIPDIVKLISDPTPSVRDAAFQTLVELYKHVGDKLKLDLQKKNLVPAAKWPILCAKFDEVKNNGEMFYTATKSVEADEPDRITKPVVPVKKPGLMSAPKPWSAQQNQQTPSGAAGAVDEETFTSSFEDVPTVQIFSPKDITEHLKLIQATISNSNKEWNKRQDCLKKIRSLVIAGAANHEEFFVGLKQLDLALQSTTKDLRSQIVREACITIAYLAKELGSKLDKFFEMVLPNLISLIQNSAKVMATSGIVAVRFIIQYTHNSRLVPIVTSNATTSKSKEIRRSCYEFLSYIITNWPTSSLHKHMATIQSTIKKGVGDADQEARNFSRKTFIGFREHFPDQAEMLLNSLDPNYRKALQGESVSASSSHNNLASASRTPLPSSYRYASGSSKGSSDRKEMRAISAIDLQAAQRANARAQYAAMARSKIASGTASLTRPRKSSDSNLPPRSTTTSVDTPDRNTRRRSRSSQSQPTSRSVSPSSRIAYYCRDPRTRRYGFGIPTSASESRDTSRETSPNRSGTLGRFRQRNDRPPLSPASRPVLAQKILQQSREAENALADAFNDSNDSYKTTRTMIGMRTRDLHSDDSETSSVCSDRSMDYSARQSGSYSWSGSNQRLSARDFWEPACEVDEIISLCASSSWPERKDGLMSLQHFLKSGSLLKPDELKMLTETFTKMFMDSHTKGLSLFLDMLHELITLYKGELHYWIYILLQRVFLKIGTENLNSVQSKLMTTLDIIRSSFPIPLLMTSVCKFLVDPTQTPNTKVKITVLNYLTTLCNSMESKDFMAQQVIQPLQKIIMYSQDSKSGELRMAARNCIVAMWNCNTPLVTMLLAELPKELQDGASNIVHSHLSRNAGGSGPGSPRTLPPSGMVHKDGVNPEEIYRNLRMTTAEIQNYSFETLGARFDRERDTTSQDSGISQMSDIKGDLVTLEEKMEELNLHSAPHSMPYCGINGVHKNDTNDFRSLGTMSDADIIKSILDSCLEDNPKPIQEKRQLLVHLIGIIEKGNLKCIKTNFRKLLRIFLDHLKANNSISKAPESDIKIGHDSQTQVIVLQILTAIFKREDLRDCWISFSELLTVKVLDAHCNENKEVVKVAETTAVAMADAAFHTMINTLAPIILTSSYPLVLGAIKMATKLIESNPQTLSDEYLQLIMPGLIKGTDHVESLVRKSSIFCMVAIHSAMGPQKLETYINKLSASKIKLLHLYIDKNKSVPTSPRNINTSS